MCLITHTLTSPVKKCCPIGYRSALLDPDPLLKTDLYSDIAFQHPAFLWPKYSYSEGVGAATLQVPVIICYLKFWNMVVFRYYYLTEIQRNRGYYKYCSVRYLPSDSGGTTWTVVWGGVPRGSLATLRSMSITSVSPTTKVVTVLSW